MFKLEGLKEGDFLKTKDWHRQHWTLYEVARLTATRAVCKCGAAFMLKDGLKVGTAGGWYRTHAQVATQADLARIAVEMRVRTAAIRMAKFTVTADNLEAVEALLKAGK